MVLYFYKKYFSKLVEQWFSKFKSYIPFQGFAIQYMTKNVFRKISFCYLSKKLFFGFCFNVKHCGLTCKLLKNMIMELVWKQKFYTGTT